MSKDNRRQPSRDMRKNDLDKDLKSKEITKDLKVTTETVHSTQKPKTKTPKPDNNDEKSKDRKDNDNTNTNTNTNIKSKDKDKDKDKDQDRDELDDVFDNMEQDSEKQSKGKTKTSVRQVSKANENTKKNDDHNHYNHKNNGQKERNEEEYEDEEDEEDTDDGMSPKPNKDPNQSSLVPPKKDAEAILSSMTAQERREFRDAFRLFDKNDDGHITVKELQEVFEGLNYHFQLPQLSKMVALVDLDGNGEIDLQEFILLMKGYKYGDPKNKKSYIDELRDAFDVLDKDGDQKIQPQELAYGLKALGENLETEDIEKMIEEVDQNGDGEIDFEEFVKLMTSGLNSDQALLFRYNKKNFEW